MCASKKKFGKSLAILAVPSSAVAFCLDLLAPPFAADCLAGDRIPTIVSASEINEQILPKIVNGEMTYWYPAVGELLYKNSESCTVSLIACDTVLTAEHCVFDDADIANYKVFFQHGGIFDLKGPSAYQSDKFSYPDEHRSFADIAILKLVEPVEGIRPIPINDVREHAVGLGGTIVGFGETGGHVNDYGLKRIGAVNVEACPAAISANDLVCWKSESNDADTCNGDSGGPLLHTEGRPFSVISGVTSGGDLNCSAPDLAFDTSVFLNSNWIKSVVGSNLGRGPCGNLAPLEEDSSTRYHGFAGQLNGSHAQHIFNIQISGARELRVAVNLGKPIGVGPSAVISQPELAVFRGTSLTKDHIVCARTPEAQVAYCSVNPADDGTYTVLLSRGTTSKIADFQLVVSVF